MAIMLALSAAMVYGSADFLGGLASRRRAALSVALGAQLAGLAALLVALPFLGPATVTRADLLQGGVGGFFGGIGLVLLYRSLAQGPMSVVAPVTALSASSVPILAGLIQGERPGLAAVGGIGVALVAVVLITREHGPADHLLETRRARAGSAVLATALAGGAMFGLFFVALHSTGADSGLYPLVGARMVSVPLLAVLATSRGEGLRGVGRGADRGLVIASGVLDMAANVLYLVALRHGLLAVVSALTGLYPAATVLWAQTVLSERMRRTQIVGLGVAGVAAVLIAV